MDKTNLIKHPFNGLRIQAESKLTFDEVLRRLREATGNAPLEELNTIATAELPEEEFERQITERYVGKSGFMIFMEIVHGKWITR